MKLPDEVWADDVVRWAVKGAGYGVCVWLVSWMLIAYGESRMSAVALQAFTDAQQCATLIGPLLSAAERAVAEADNAALALDSYLQEAPALGVLVAQVEQ